MRTRRDAWKLPASDLTLEWYGKAVAAMRALPRSNPGGWDYQAAVHGVGVLPTVQNGFWAECQHGSSFFLPWHRMYLLHFERIVAAAVEKLGGPKDWALPYWNYEDPAHRALPIAFRRQSLADGSPNPLFVAQRSAGANAGQTVLTPKDVDLARCLKAPGTTSPGGFFGGAAPAHFGNAGGELELTPHNTVHVAVGRPNGLMIDPDFAALDPIFWLHHANIDRLWEVWLRRDPTHRNPTSAYWLTGVPFQFHDATGGVVTMRTLDVLSLAAPVLDYTYEDLTDPLTQLQGFVVPAAPPPSGAADLVGATTTAVHLTDHVEHVAVPTPVSPAAFRRAGAPDAFVAPGAPASQLVQQVTLVLDNVTSDATGPTYDVYVNVPTAADPTQHEDRFVGRVALFGIKQASDPAGLHGGSGQTIALDITALYHRLDDAKEIDPSNLRVSFVPIEPEPGTKVTVGRVSLYFA